MPCKCGKPAEPPVIYKGETLCVECGFKALEKAKDNLAAIADLNDALNDTRGELAKAEAAIAAVAKATNAVSQAESVLSQALSALTLAQKNAEKAQEERAYALTKIDEIESKIEALQKE